ncbi:MAG: hypothetical protein J6W29_05685, partial [Neisseriaceae bacterium]|nr:hypothetical protein [Neisseriaceae bacterium]
MENQEKKNDEVIKDLFYWIDKTKSFIKEYKKDDTLSFWIVSITVIIFVLSIIFYSDTFHYLSDKPEHWGIFGDYIGGFIGTVIAFFVFLATLRIIKLQKKTIDLQENELKDTQRIFNQEQFEQTFFNLIKLIGEIQRDKISYTYPLVIETIKYIIDYKEKTKSDIKKYINIFKPLLDDKTLCDLMVTIKNNDDKNLKTFVENNAFFEFINELYFNTDNMSSDDYKKAEIETLLYFDISAFGDNINYQRKVSQSEYVTGDFLDKLLEITKYDEVKINIAGNPKTNPDTLSKLFD